MNDLVADALARMRNADRAGKASCIVLSSRLVKGLLRVMEAQGYIESYTEKKVRAGVAVLDVVFKKKDGQSAFRDFKRVSKSGRRVYCPVSRLPRVNNGLGIAILSTSKGVVCDRQASEKNVGGEVLCYVY